MNKLALYYFPSCPFCQYVLASLDSMSLDIELKNINQDFDARNELMAGGGKTQVPCLKIEKDGDTQWMYESRDIVDYLLKENAQTA